MPSVATTARAALRPASLAAALLLGTAIAAVPVQPAMAQQSQASLRGTITGGATEVAAVEVNTGIRRSVTVDADGRYNFPSLRPGTYRLEVTINGAVRPTDTFQLAVAQSAQLDFDLTDTAAAPATDPASDDAVTDADVAGDEIIVTASRIQTLEGGEVGATISQRLIEQLPQNNRNFLAFAELAPGVQLVEGGNGNARLRGGAQGSNSVNVFIDGLSQKDYVLSGGVTGQDSSQGNPFPQLAVGEYRVISSNYKAEFDQVSSVAITAVTKSGTNEFHGEAFVDYTDESFRAPTPTELFSADGEKTPTQFLQFGGALGGPIIKDLAHFFVTYEGKRIDRPVDILPGGGIDPSALPPEYQGLFGPASSRFEENLYFGKVDLVPTDRDLFELSVKYRDETGRELPGGIVTAQASTETEVDEIRVVGRWEHTADTWVNDFKVAYQDVSWSPRPTVDAIGQLFRRTEIEENGASQFDLFRIGGGTNFQDKGQKGWELQNDFTYTGLDRHTIKTGVKTRWLTLNTLQQNFSNPLYTYDVNLNGPDGFNQTIPYRLQFGAASGPGNSVVTSDNFQFGIYVQDDWDVTDRLTLNLGIRWDYESTPAYLDFVTPDENLFAVSPENYPNLTNADYDIRDFISTGTEREAFLGAFQPRIGFSYQLDEDARFTVFGGYGRSYDRTQFDFLQQEISVGAYQVRTFNFQDANSLPNSNCTASSTCVPWDPRYLTAEGRAELAASSVGGGRELRFITNDLKIPYSDQFSLGLRTRFDPVELEVGYSHVESRDGFAYLLGNRRADGSFFFDNPDSATDTPSSPFGFAPPGFGSILIGTNGLETTADSVFAKLTKRYTVASPWSLDATYTYTDATENRSFGEYFSLDYPSIDDYPVLRSSGVPRHRLVAAGSVDTPIGLTMSFKFTYQSPIFLKSFLSTAIPFERTIVGTEAEALGDRWGRRQFDFAATKYIDLPFLSDESRIRLRVDILNLFNDRNYVNFNTNALDDTRTDTSPTIFGERVGDGIGGNAPRTVKVSAGFSF